MSFLQICFLLQFLLVNGQRLDNSSFRVELPTGCGTTRFDEDGGTRIIDGNKASLGQFPWMARVGLRRRRQIGFFCGGSLISNYHVITAAHCNRMKGNIVRLGENLLNTYKDCENGICAPRHQDIQIKKFIRHEKYCSIRRVNDVALIKLRKAVRFNDFVQPICLPPGPLSHRELMKENLIVSGWGLIRSQPKRFPKYLMYISVPLLNDIKCNSIFSKDLAGSQLCIGDETDKSACGGDSGGPVTKFMTVNGKMKAYVVGLVSYGRAICGGPAVYTDVSYFVPWALAKLKKN